MESSKRNLEIDPDYELNETAMKRIKIKEHTDKEQTVNKIKDIINRHFNAELAHRQNQLEVIQQRITKVRKTMHMLRYVLVTSYYNNKNCVLNAVEDTPGSSDEIPMIDPQNRIHPAVKKLLGKNSIDNFTYLASRRNKNKTTAVNSVSQESSAEALSTSENADISERLTFKCEVLEESEVKRNVIVFEDKPKIEAKGAAKVQFCDSIRNRKKTKYRVVIGNISKWMPSESQEDNSTHKWMMYVRGTKDSPSVSHFIQKVVFYLHPSYKPNDVIELKNDPFHLSRKGWGEFPVRVQIFFCCTLNKPVDIIHNLKLDRTYTGRQTLGNETIVDLFLYEDNLQNETNQKTDICEVKLEPTFTDPADSLSSTGTLGVEHNYCTSQQDTNQNVLVRTTEKVAESKNSESTAINHILRDHSYCVLNGIDNNIDAENENGINYNLIHGVPPEDTDQLETSEEVICDFTPDSEYNSKKLHSTNSFKKILNGVMGILTQNNKVFIVHKPNGPPQQSIIKKNYPLITLNTCDNINLALQATIDLTKYELAIPNNRFKNVLEALPFLFQRLPLVTPLANDLNYKCLYPYATGTVEEYSSWNIGKQLSCEWRRAKMIQKLLATAKPFGYEEWNTKSLILYGRSHGYTISCNYGIFKKNLQMKKLLTKYKMPEGNVIQAKRAELDMPINVTDSDNDSCNEDTEEDPQLINIVDANLSLECAYIHKIASNKIKLQLEQIVPGILFNGAERMILESVKCLINNLLRNSRTHLVFKDNFREETSRIGVEEVMNALEDRSEFQPILNKQTEMQYYW